MSELLQPMNQLGSASGRKSATVLDVVIPVYNEEAQLGASVERVLAHLRTMPWDFRITIADNASTD
ncbi:MAG: glycosyltransferase, partial [Nocardioidaceae bacterium]